MCIVGGFGYLAVVLVAAVGEVHAHHVHAGVEELTKRFHLRGHCHATSRAVRGVKLTSLVLGPMVQMMLVRLWDVPGQMARKV